jgi:hypothetical protein
MPEHHGETEVHGGEAMREVRLGSALQIYGRRGEEDDPLKERI